jgi:hypothetical protein
MNEKDKKGRKYKIYKWQNKYVLTRVARLPGLHGYGFGVGTKCPPVPIPVTTRTRDPRGLTNP